MTSNNFVTPAASKSITLARFDWNDALRASTENFYGPVAPTSENYQLDNNPTAVQDGVLYRSTLTNSIFIVDSINQKGNPVHGGNFTRVGIGFRLESTLAATDFSTYEIGEMFATVGISVANTRVYLKASNANQIVDVGIPATDTVATDMLQAASVTKAKLATAAVIKIVNSAVSSGSNVFALGAGATPLVTSKLMVLADGIYQGNSHWVYNSGNNTVQFKDASVPSGINVYTEALVAGS